MTGAFHDGVRSILVGSKWGIVSRERRIVGSLPAAADPSASPGQMKALIIWIGILSASAFWPFAIFRFPGLQDYPNHLARAFILLNPSDPLLGSYYKIAWSPIPNLGWDFWAISVGRVLTLEWTGKLFLILSGAITVAGCFALNRAIVGRLTAAPLLIFPFLFNTGFSRGFLSFNFGFGLALWACVWWFQHDESRWRRRLAGATLFSSVLYIVHLYALAIYGVFVIGLTLSRILGNSRAGCPLIESFKTTARDGLQIVPAALMATLALHLTRNEPSGAISGIYAFEWPFSRLSDLDQLIDVGIPLVNDIFIAIMSAAVLLAILTKRLRLRSKAGLAIVLCVLLFFVLPGRLEGTHFVSWRIVFAGLVFLIASLDPTRDFQNERIFPTLFILTTAVTFCVALMQARAWSASERGRMDFSRLIKDLPEGSALFIMHSGIPEREVRARTPGLYHVGSYAVIEKRALVQSLFTYAGQQPLQYRDFDLQTATEHSAAFLGLIWDNAIESGQDLRQHILRFDYVVIHGPETAFEKLVLPMQNMSAASTVNDFRLYAVTNHGNLPVFSSVLRTGSQPHGTIVPPG